METLISQDIKQIFSLFKSHNYEINLVGGCVRDYLLNRPLNDFDLTTNATPEEMKEILKDYRTIDTGIKHGTISLMMNHVPYEITTYRRETAYTDHRHPDNVMFSKTLEEDLLRRDFTINALAFNGNEIIDNFNGQEDLRNKIIRAIGNPEERFAEDALRILRAIRFSGKLNFEIEPKTKEAIFKCKDLLQYVAVERIFKEFKEILVCDNVEEILREYEKVFSVFVPELHIMVNYDQHSKYHCYDLWEHTLKTVANTNNDLTIRLSALLHDIGKPDAMSIDPKDNSIQHYYNHQMESRNIASKILKRFNCDSKLSSDCLLLIENHDIRIEENKKSVKKALNKIGDIDLFNKLLILNRADNKAHAKEYTRDDEYYINLKKIVADISINNEIFKVSELAVDGNDMLKLGFLGKTVGDKLNYLLMNVIQENVKNEKDELIKFLEVNDYERV